MTTPGGGDGVLAVVVWPTYVGVASAINGTADEPIGHPDYQRGQIIWTPVADERQVIGRARIICPPGTWTTFIYFQHPTSPQFVGFTQMDQPITFTEPRNVLDVDPIVNNDLQLAARM